MLLHNHVTNHNSEYINDLKQLLNRESLALLVGAGVSTDYCNHLLWGDLVLNLFRQKFAAMYSYLYNKPFDFDDFLAKHSGDGAANEKASIRSSFLDIAEYASSSQLYNQSITQFEKFNDGFIQKIVKDVFVQNHEVSGMNHDDSTLKELALLSFNAENGQSRIDTIITYNYDDFMEAVLLQVMKEYVDQAKKEIRNADEFADHCKKATLNVATVYESNSLHPHLYKNAIEFSRSISVYHVHGFFPVAFSNSYCQAQNLSVPDASEKIILGEGSYNALRSSDLLWANSVQAQVYHQKAFLCVGFSCTDPNFRRLITTIRKNNQLHIMRSRASYVILPVSDYTKELGAMLNIGSLNDTEEDERLKVCYLNIVEQYFLDQFGLRIIWAEDFAAIPKLIRQVRGAMT